jgi:hypothetical protein
LASDQQFRNQAQIPKFQGSEGRSLTFFTAVDLPSIGAVFAQNDTWFNVSPDFFVRGFEVEAFCLWYCPWPKGIRKRLQLFVVRALCCLLAVDLRPDIVEIGEKKTPAAPEIHPSSAGSTGLPTAIDFERWFCSLLRLHFDRICQVHGRL